MSDSYNTEHALIELAEKLEAEAASLREAAGILRVLRDANHHQEEIKAAKERAKDWLKR